MKDDRSWQRTVVVHTAESIGEAMVLRSLLEGAGIRSPVPSSTNLFAESGPPGGRGVDVYAFESKADEARALIAEYLSEGESEESEPADEQG